MTKEKDLVGNTSGPTMEEFTLDKLTNDSKVITIRHEKDLEQIEKPTADSGNLYRLYAFTDPLENSLMKYLSPPFGMVSGLHIVLTFAWCVIIHLTIHLINNHGSSQKV